MQQRRRLRRRRRLQGSGGELQAQGRPPSQPRRLQALAGHGSPGYEEAGDCSSSQYFFTPKDLPYRTQLVPLAAIFAVSARRLRARASGCSSGVGIGAAVFGELYGSATETRFARDLPEVLQWVSGGPEPDTVSQASFAPGTTPHDAQSAECCVQGLVRPAHA